MSTGSAPTIHKTWPAIRLTLSLLAITSGVSAAERSYEFSHFAGTLGGPGYVDGIGGGARLNQPRGIVRDANGNLYVGELGNSVIRKISPQGATSLFAGSLERPGSADGAGAAAQFNQPIGLCFDQLGNLYVADENNHTIRKITPAGVVSTVAGIAGQAGAADGPVQVATFNRPWSVAADSSGNVYVAELGSPTIRKISGGVVTTLAGKAATFGTVDAAGSAARFLQPTAIVCTSSGDLFVTDRYAIRKVTPAGEVTTAAGSVAYSGLDDGTGAAARFQGPWALSLDAAANVIYVADGNAIRKLTLGGAVSTEVTIGTSWLTGIVSDGSGGVFCTDSLQAVYKYTPSTGVGVFVGAVAEYGHVDGTGSSARFTGPVALAFDTIGNLFVAEPHSIRKITPSGVVSTFAGSPTDAGGQDGVGISARFFFPGGLAFDKTGNLFVVHGLGGKLIRRVTPDGTTTTLFGNGDITWGDFPIPIAVDNAGNVFTRFWQCSIEKITPQGTITIVAGDPHDSGTEDGAGGNARFSPILSFARDEDGTFYVADILNFTVRKVTADGVVSTLAGNPNDENPRSVDGIGSEARFAYPIGIAIEASGDLLVLDSGAIRRVTKAGKVTTIAGKTDTGGTADGIGTNARFSTPVGIVRDNSGAIYIADRDNYVIRKGVPVVINQTAPAITWAAAAAIQSGTPISAAELNATANAPGSFSYDPALGTILSPGTHTLTVTFTPTDTFNYSSATAQVTLTVNAASSRLANISARGYCSTGDRVMIGGFVVSGSAPKRILIRAVGPSLVSQGLGSAEVLLDPVIEVHKGVPIIASNDNWADDGNGTDITTTAAQIGAAALVNSDTKSAALLLTLQTGVYSFVASGKGGTAGIVLLEVYDADAVTGGSTFVNIATRAYSTSGNGVTIGGFVISGNQSKQVLLRAVGPTLAKQGIGQAELLADPTIELHDALHGNTVVASNDNWGENANAGAILSTAARIGAAPLDSSDAKSSALLLTLPPGVYSFIAGGKSASTGIVLVEVYDAD